METTEKPDRWTIGEVLRWTEEYLRQKGVAAPRLDAEVLLAYALDRDRVYLYMNFDKPLSKPERDAYRRGVARRANREPVALITGKKEFWSISLSVPRGVLIPRPDTETLVQVALDQIAGVENPRILELGTGSGAISIAIAKERPDAVILATDIDPLAALTAKRNAETAEVSISGGFLVTNLFDALKPTRRFDLICSNPPYIPDDEIERLAPEIRDYEPIRALAAGPDGLDVIRTIARQSRSYLAEGGALALEIGYDQTDQVQELFSSDGGLIDVTLHRDLAGNPRVVKGRFNG